MPLHYLLKSEPLPRFEDGVDVSYPFSRLLDSPSHSTTWDGVRNPRAGKTLKGMKVGDEAFWYHSNTKRPEIVGVVKVIVDGENQPDHTAFDPSSPYYDSKSSKENPRWFMPTVQHAYPLKNALPLSLLQHITSSSSLTESQRKDIHYLTDAQLESIRTMDLLRLGRLSVQPVSEEAWTSLCLMAEQGGWEDWKGKWVNTSMANGKSEISSMDKGEGKKHAEDGKTTILKHERADDDEVGEKGEVEAPPSRRKKYNETKQGITTASSGMKESPRSNTRRSSRLQR